MVYLVQVGHYCVVGEGVETAWEFGLFAVGLGLDAAVVDFLIEPELFDHSACFTTLLLGGEERRLRGEV